MKKRVMHSKKKSQIATEYLVIVGLVIAILAPTAYFMFTYQGSSTEAIKASKLDNAANEIISAANNLYSYGSQSKTTVDVTIPEGVESIEFEGNEIVFNYLASDNSINQLAKSADTNLVGATINNPLPGVLQMVLTNLNIQVCVSVPPALCEACPGVLICDETYNCGDGPNGIDDVCPNEYFPTGYGGDKCSINPEDNCYDVDCVCETGTGEDGCSNGVCVNGQCGSCSESLNGWCSINSNPYTNEERCCLNNDCELAIQGSCGV